MFSMPTTPISDTGGVDDYRVISGDLSSTRHARVAPGNWLRHRTTSR